MGLFSRNKTYSFANVKRMLQTDKYADYVAVPVSEGKYRLVPEDKDILKYRERREEKTRKNEKFKNEISGNGAYQNLGRVTSNYGNYQNPKQYHRGNYVDFRG